MPESTELLNLKGEVLTAMAERLESKDLRAGFVHGIEGFPHTLGRDVDVLVHPDERKEVLMCLQGVLECYEFDVVVARTPWAEWVVGYKLHSGHIIGLEIDLFSEMNWAWVALVKPEAAIQIPGLGHSFRVHPWAGFVKRVLLQIISGNLHRFYPGKEYTDEFVVLEFERNSVQKYLQDYFGSTWSTLILNAIERHDLDWFQDHLPQLRKIMLFKAFRRPFLVIRNLLVWVRNERYLSLWPKPCAPVVHFIGRHEEEVSRVAEAVSKVLEADFIFTSIDIQLTSEVPQNLSNLKKRRLQSGRLGVTFLLSTQDPEY